MSDENDPKAQKTETTSKKKGEKAKNVIDYNTLLPDFLRLIPDDITEVPSPPDVTGKSPIEAGKAMGEYYRTLAAMYAGTAAKNKARTRAMIILGAIVSGIKDADLQASIRAHFVAKATERDQTAAAEVVEWLKQPEAPKA